ncbi:hypothetical protein AVEN_261671-1 [Araneus ventricosus]|uniref:Uncharacterized protein n=1 Tax=Araneus ventricosus TaxID=182803 RepID=A0A4Y2DUK2_ARAVE|nr:hypothetical protein AVEN_261671-1 [Araneus ventricosus]
MLKRVRSEIQTRARICIVDDGEHFGHRKLRGSDINFKLSLNLRSSLKAFQTLERMKFAAAEKDKMEKILKLARNLGNCEEVA